MSRIRLHVPQYGSLTGLSPRLIPRDENRRTKNRRPTVLDDVERDHIMRVLAEWPTLEDADETLGIGVSTRWRKRKRYKIN